MLPAITARTTIMIAALRFRGFSILGMPFARRAMNKKMWGGRFGSGPDAIMEEINASIGFDRRLYAQDIKGSLAHARMLAEQGIISKSDAAEIRHGLEK